MADVLLLGIDVSRQREFDESYRSKLFFFAKNEKLENTSHNKDQGTRYSQPCELAKDRSLMVAVFMTVLALNFMHWLTLV